MSKRRQRNLKSLSVPAELRPMSSTDAQGSISVESMVLEPQSRTSDSSNATGIVKWKLPRAGIMQRDIRFLFRIVNITGNEGLYAFAMNVGSLGCIERAILSTSSGQILHDVDQSNFLSIIKQAAVPVSTLNNIDRAELGCVNPFEFSASSTAATDGQLTIPTSEYSNSGSGGKTIQFSGFKTRVNTNSQWSVPLHKIFPVLAEDTSFFPLYKLKEELIIEIHKANKNAWLISSSAVDAANQVPVALPANVEIDNERLAINIIHYPPKVLAGIEKNMLGKVYPFVDYALVRKNFPAIAVNGNALGQQIVRVGLQGRTLRNIYCVKNHPDKNAWFGDLYSAHMPKQTWNVKINDRLLFNTNIDNPAREYDLLEECDEEVKPQVSLPLYSNNHQLRNAQLCSNTLGIGGRSDLHGRQNILGVDLKLIPNKDLIDGNGIAVGTANCEVLMDFNRIDAQDEDSNGITQCKFFFCYARAYSLGADGSLVTSY
tara:strand:+ start:145 stop:1605 length:1461 start_codon:yes stop_codon:yes gene_type:complete